MSPHGVPLLNTAVLLLSGGVLTRAHNILLMPHVRTHQLFFSGLEITVALGLIFTSLQAFEFLTAPFNSQDTVYGSIFYLATGFHGFHVILGTVFLYANLKVFKLKHNPTFKVDIGGSFLLLAASWYWHFVDVV
jgi:cytochrome c oxidase subunit 3